MLRWVWPFTMALRVLISARRGDRTGSTKRFPKMLNSHLIPPRALLRLRVPLSQTTFRQQSCLRLRTQIYGRVERRYTSTISSADPSPTSTPSQPRSWVEFTPKKFRPYLYLARVDKPIGTLLLYYPCSMSPSPKPGISES